MEVSRFFDDSDTTLTGLLQARLEAEPDAEWCCLVDADGNSDRVSVRRLMERVYAYARVFGAARQEPVQIGICLYHSLDLHAAFIGAMWAGHIPTMLAPPSPRMEAEKYNRNFAQTIRCVQPAKLAIAREVSERLMPTTLESFAGIELINPVGEKPVEPVMAAETAPDSVALIQHSSGTTGLQKGVALSHRAIVSHNRAYAERLKMTTSDTIVTWLPLYHDMGLIACFLLPLTGRIRLVQMSQFDWVLRPAMLFEKIAGEKGTLCWLPNFAYSFLAQNVRSRQMAGIDLSSMRAWVNCSEPVYERSHQEFLAEFSTYGAELEQLTISYAMAENVFAVTQSLPSSRKTISIDPEILAAEHRAVETAMPASRTLVSNGKPVGTTQVLVIDDNDKAVDDGVVGQLAVKGDTLFSGYYQREDLTSVAMTADGWFRTGDLGFILDGEVFVTGRKKDLIIVQGRNFYPSDIEDTVGRVPGVASGRVVSFGLEDEELGTEKLVILAEPAPHFSGNIKMLALKIRNAVAQELDVTASHVQIVDPRTLVKSTSGKIARNDNREKYNAGRF